MMPPWLPVFWQANGKHLISCWCAIRPVCCALDAERLVVIFAEKPARDLKEETHQRIRKGKQELSDILAQ